MHFPATRLLRGPTHIYRQHKIEIRARAIAYKLYARKQTLTMMLFCAVIVVVNAFIHPSIYVLDVDTHFIALSWRVVALAVR